MEIKMKDSYQDPFAGRGKVYPSGVNPTRIRLNHQQSSTKMSTFALEKEKKREPQPIETP
jgi:hypothetical protein